MSAEFGEYLSAFEEEKLPDGRRRMVRNGHLPERQILTGIGAVDVRVPKGAQRAPGMVASLGVQVPLEPVLEGIDREQQLRDREVSWDGSC